MSACIRPPVLLAVVAAGAIALSGCGSIATKTVTISGSIAPRPVPQSTATTGTTPSSPAPTTHANTGTSTSETGGAEATHTSTAPEFTKESPSGEEGLSTALAVVKAHGYTANDTSEYHPAQTLRVLVGTRDGSGEQAFFFIDGHYLGTDTKEPSASVGVSGQSDTEVTLDYPLYRAGQPTGGKATVHFQLNNGRLVPLNPIPPTSSQSGVGR